VNIKLSLSLVSLIAFFGIAYLYLFPDTLLLTDRCSCGRSRSYYQVRDAKYGSAIYNLKLQETGDTSPSHHHEYTDPQYTDVGRVPRWTLHFDGPQILENSNWATTQFSSPSLFHALAV